MLEATTEHDALPRPRQEHEEVRVNERRELRARVHAAIVPGLEELVDPDADPADLIARAVAQSNRLRADLEVVEPEGDLRSRDAVARRARDDEREWVRGHLHDTALQILEFIAGDGFGTGLTAAQIAHLAGGAARDLRRWIDNVDQPAVAELLPALEQIAAQARTPSLSVRFVVGEIGVPPNGDQASAIAGAAREAVTNARKHARASQVIVRVQSAGDGRTLVTVSDDGIGFDPARAAGGRGLGVRTSIIGRMRRAGGHASIEQAPGGGTLVTLLTCGQNA